MVRETDGSINTYDRRAVAHRPQRDTGGTRSRNGRGGRGGRGRTGINRGNRQLQQIAAMTTVRVDLIRLHTADIKKVNDRLKRDAVNEIPEDLAGCFEWLYRMPGYSHDDHDDFDEAFQWFFREPGWTNEDVDSFADAFDWLYRMPDFRQNGYFFSITAVFAFIHI